MSKAKFEAVKELIQAKQYVEARALLKTIDHPTARQWEAKLDWINPQPLPSTTSKFAANTKIKLVLLGIGALIITIFLVSQLLDNVRINRNMEQIKRNSQIALDAIDECSVQNDDSIREICVETYKRIHGYVHP